MGGLGRYNQNEASQSSVFHNSKQLNSNRNICSVFTSLKSVSSMPSHCCVPECTQRGYQSNDGGKVSFFNFPKALIKRKQWIHAIRRDEGKEFQINEKTKVCSLHFKSTDLKKSLNGRIHPLPDAVPSKFKWKDSPKKRKPPKERIPLSKPATPSTTTTQVQVEVETSTTAPVTVQEELNAALERVKVLEQHLFNIQNELLQSQKSAEMLENKNQALKKTTADLTSENALLSSKLFNVDRFTKDEDVAFYTGFPSRDAFSSILEFLNPGTNCENIRSREKNNTEVPDDFYEDEFEPQVNVKARQRKIKPEDQFFLVMCRLRRGFSVQHLAHLYGESQSTISRIFIPWINFLYRKAGFHMIADRRSQKVLRSSAIIWKHTSAIACDSAIVIADDRRRSQTIAEDRTMFYLLRSSAIVCDHLRSFAILRSYGNQSSAICDPNVSHNIFNSGR